MALFEIHASYSPKWRMRSNFGVETITAKLLLLFSSSFFCVSFAKSSKSNDRQLRFSLDGAVKNDFFFRLSTSAAPPSSHHFPASAYARRLNENCGVFDGPLWHAVLAGRLLRIDTFPRKSVIKVDLTAVLAKLKLQKLGGVG